MVFSWDGAGEVGNGLFPRFLELAKEHDATMTFFLSGLYLLPESKKTLYHPPNNPLGASDIGYLTDEHVKRPRWSSSAGPGSEGHEIGTHFNGHFCGGHGAVGKWTPAQWRSEIDQAKSFVKEWRTNTGWTDLPSLPFDYDKELIGGRTPCLLGQDNLLPTARELGWRYDASSPGGRQVWPTKKHGHLGPPAAAIPFPGHSFQVLSMDYNILANQSVNSTKATRANYPRLASSRPPRRTYGLQPGIRRTGRPFFIGNHFEHWNGGIYMDAVEEAFKHIRTKKGARACPSGSSSTGWTSRSRRCSRTAAHPRPGAVAGLVDGGAVTSARGADRPPDARVGVTEDQLIGDHSAASDISGTDRFL